MPRKKRTIVEETLPDNPAIENETGDPLLDPDASSDEILDAVLDNFGESPYSIKVYKVTNGNKSFCFKIDSKIDESYIQDQYPLGGKFLVCIYVNGRIFKTVYFDIEAKPIPNTPNGNGNGHGSAADIQNRMLLDELQWSRQMILQMMGNGQARQPQTSLTELVTALNGLNNLSGKKDPIDLLVKGMEIGSKSGGSSGDWKTELVQTVKEVAVPAVSAFAEYQKNQTIGGINPMPVKTNMLPESALKQGLNWLKPKIMVGMPVELAADWIVTNANDEQYQELVKTIINDGLPGLIVIDPELNNEPYKTWMTNVIDLIREAFREQNANNTSTDHDGRTGDDSDDANDEKVSA
jgi:hypothetical protein